MRFRHHVLCLALVAACGSDAPVAVTDAGSRGDAAPTPAACETINWRNPNPGTVSCPGVSSCQCGGPDVCCVGRRGDEITGSSCQSLESCAGVAFECDGPEDCAEGLICCASVPDAGGGGAACVEERDCFGLNEVTLCRGDADCGPLENCIPASRDAYFRETVGYCDL